MKEIFTAPNVIPCDLLKAILEAHGIRSFIKYEHGSPIFGIEDPASSCPFPPFAWPKVWVQDEDFPQANEIVAECQNEKRETNVLRTFRRDEIRKCRVFLGKEKHMFNRGEYR
jgi:hypothetical protein